MHMNNETQTQANTQPETSNPENVSTEPNFDSHVNDVLELQKLSERAQSIADLPPAPDVDVSTEKKGMRPLAIAGTVLAAGAVLGVGANALDHALPQETVAVATGTVEQGGDITQSVDDAIEQIESQGVDPADPNERQDVIYQAVDLHTEDGIVQPGTEVEVTAVKSPLFGDITYKATEPVENTSSSFEDMQLPTLSDTPPAPEQSTSETN